MVKMLCMTESSQGDRKVVLPAHVLFDHQASCTGRDGFPARLSRLRHVARDARVGLGRAPGPRLRQGIAEVTFPAGGPVARPISQCPCPPPPRPSRRTPWASSPPAPPGCDRWRRGRGVGRRGGGRAGNRSTWRTGEASRRCLAISRLAGDSVTEGMCRLRHGVRAAFRSSRLSPGKLSGSRLAR
jgi:hypothetical protein